MHHMLLYVCAPANQTRMFGAMIGRHGERASVGAEEEEAGIVNEAGGFGLSGSWAWFATTALGRAACNAGTNVGLSRKIEKRVHYFLVTLKGENSAFVEGAGGADGTTALRWVG